MSVNLTPQATLPELVIPDAVQVPAGTPNPLYAVGRAALNNGLKVFVQAWTGMARGDIVRVFWDDTDVPFATATVDETNQGRTLGLDLPESLFSDGTFSPWYQVERFSGTAPLEGAPRDILVKTTLPGGRDPNPSSPIHDGLFAPLVSPEVAEGGVSEEIAAQGVDVTVPAWSGMAAWDRLDFSWGGERLTHIVQPGEENQPVVIHVETPVILAAGDGKILLMYQIIDAAANRSEGWSKETAVDVFAAAAVLSAPKVVEAVDGNLDADALAGAGATVQIITSDCYLSQGDALTLTWRGVDASGTVVIHTETRPIAAVPPDIEIFTVPDAVIRAVVGGMAVVSYSVVTSQGTLVSRRTSVQVTGTVQTLPAPAVTEASGDTLDAGLPQAHAVIEPWPGMAAGDLVTLRWDGVQQNGAPYSHTQEKLITSTTAGKEVIFTVDAEHIAVLDGGSLDLFWLLDGVSSRHAGDTRTARESAHLRLFVGVAHALLPAPSVVPLKNGAIESSQPSVTVTVPATAGTQKGDVVWLWWQQDGGAAVQLDHVPVSQATEGKALPFEVDSTNYAYAARVGLFYTLVRGTVTLTSHDLNLPVSAGDTVLPVPTVAPLKNGNIEPSQPILVATVPAGVTIRNDVVHLWWSQDGAAHADLGYIPVSSATEGKALPFDVEPLNYRDADQVNLYYTIVRNGGAVTLQSAALSLKVDDMPVNLPAPTVPEAVNGELDSSLLSATIRVSGLVAGEAVSGLFGATTLDAVQADGQGNAEILVTREAIEAAAGSDIRVYYAVVRNGAGVLSEPLALRVSNAGRRLPAPSVPEAEGGTIADSDSDAHIVVPAGALRAGERVRGVTGSAYTAEVVTAGADVLSITVPATQLSPLAGTGTQSWGYEVYLDGAWRKSATVSISVAADAGPWTEDFNSVPLGFITPGTVLSLTYVKVVCASATSAYPQVVEKTAGDHYLTDIVADITMNHPLKSVKFQAASEQNSTKYTIFATDGTVLTTGSVYTGSPTFLEYTTTGKPIGRIHFYLYNLSYLDNITMTPYVVVPEGEDIPDTGPGPWTESFDDMPAGFLLPGTVVNRPAMKLLARSLTTVDYPQVVSSPDGNTHLFSIGPDATFRQPLESLKFQAASAGSYTNFSIFATDGTVLTTGSVGSGSPTFLEYTTTGKPIGRIHFYLYNLSYLDNITMTPYVVVPEGEDIPDTGPGPWTESFDDMPAGFLLPGTVLNRPAMKLLARSLTTVDYPQVVSSPDGNTHLFSIGPDVTFRQPLESLKFQAASAGNYTNFSIFATDGTVLTTGTVSRGSPAFLEYTTTTNGKPIGRISFYSNNLSYLDNITMTPWKSELEEDV